MVENNYKIINNIPIILKYSARIRTNINISVDKYWLVITYGNYQFNYVQKWLENKNFIKSIENISKKNPYNDSEKSIYIFGKKLKIIFNKDFKKPFTISDNYLYIKDNQKYNNIELIIKTCKKLAIKYITKLFWNTVNEKYDIFNNNASLYNISLRYIYMKTRWGVNKSFNNNNVITLNVKLIHFNYKTIQYVIEHELAHCFYLNHSKEYWEFVKLINPNYKFYIQKLKEYDFS